jgi:hypothetical protein
VVLGLGGKLAPGGKREPVRERGSGFWAGLVFFSSSLFLFLFLLLSYTQLIQTNLIEFKISLNSSSINSTQGK